MRPPILNPLFAALSALPGIGPKLEKFFARLLSRDGEPPRLIDLLFHLPTGFVDRRNQPKLSEVPPDTIVTVAVTVERHRPPPPHRPRAPYNIDTFDDTNTLTITYFNARKDYLEKLLPRASCATSRAQRPSTTAICRWCIPTAWSMPRILPDCR
jgi:ATP-dependent DNA helicase RecG